MNQQAINAALCAKSPDERTAITDKYGITKDEVLKFWNGGNICGQCKHYSPLGGIPYLNGTCGKVAKNGYTRPGDVACKEFKR